MNQWLKVILAFNCSIFLTLSCTSLKNHPVTIDDEHLAYELLNQFDIIEGALFYKTKGFDVDNRLKDWFNYESINFNNRKESYILERDRFVDFDTVFSSQQQEKLDNNLKNIEPVNLKEEKLNINRLRYTRKRTELDVDFLQALTFPIIQRDKNDNIFAFFFYSWSSIDGLNGSSEIYIYKRDGDKWERFAVVFVSIT
ncbi:hypothetical protein [Litoribacter populi]|uniref:hypothetical protein n=1 Tax=Litoribacter populi TaxID=2598460 RepID=UPI00117D7694|nr:hypothetical protein [Litoribacter populi]